MSNIRHMREKSFRIRNKRRKILNIIKEAYSAANLKPALESLVNSFTSIYPGKIWIVEEYGKRKSYIAGSGNESYQPAEKLLIIDNYYLFLQGFPDLKVKEKELIKSIFKLVIIAYGG